LDGKEHKDLPSYSLGNALHFKNGNFEFNMIMFGSLPIILLNMKTIKKIYNACLIFLRPFFARKEEEEKMAYFSYLNLTFQIYFKNKKTMQEKLSYYSSL
jgi:hypothetical protein